ncbi:CAP domain-containing protein [Acutalibacter muris]|uniref:CAP domain-containing protein n=1 Tax=Acutalibacter muris TaxID=1796620 RepID=UPI001C3E95E0|nr:S-layer homology domain-containing protein [Acutalibacter muris]
MKVKNRKGLAALVLAVVMLATIVSAAVPASAAVSDVKPNNWAYEAVQYNVENKLIAVDYDTYNMNAPAPRQDVAYALFKTAMGKDTEPSQSVYTQYIPQDMKNSPDKYKYSVQWAVENSIIAGTKSEGDRYSANYKLWFSPGNIITREQMATLLYRIAQYEGLDTDNYNTNLLDKYTDGWSTSKWAQNAMAWCVSNKLMTGVSANKMSPRTTLTFGQLAQVMMNFGKLRDASQGPVETPEPTPVPTPDPTPSPAPSPKPDDMDLSGPWDYVQPITELPIGGYMKNGHRYNRYNVCIDTVDGIPTDDEKKAFLLINEYRASKGVHPLLWDQCAQVIAETRAIEGYKCHTDNSTKFGHTRPNGDDKNNLVTGIIMEWANIGALKGKTYDPFAWENGFKADEYWENEWGYHTGYGPKEIVDGWIASPGHEAALVRDKSRPAELYGAVAVSHFDTDYEIDEWGNKTNINYWYFNTVEVWPF